MHPLIRVLCFLVFSACLAFGGVVELLCGIALLAGAYLSTSRRLFKPGTAMIYRIRWFLLSLLVVYGWFTPGQPLAGAEGSWLAALVPTQQGLQAGLVRMAVLVAIVAGANLLLGTTSREQLLCAVYGLARPLALLGVSRERLAVRTLLVIEALDPVRRIVTGRLTGAEGAQPSLRTAGRFASDVMLEVMRHAEQATQETVQLPRLEAPAPLQWVYPMLLWGLFFAAARIGVAATA